MEDKKITPKKAEFISKKVNAFDKWVGDAMAEGILNGLESQDQYLVLELFKHKLYEAIGFHIQITFTEPDKFFVGMLKNDTTTIPSAFSEGCRRAIAMKDKVKKPVIVSSV